MAEPAITQNPMTAEMAIFPWWLFLLWGLLTILIGLSFLFSPAVTTVLLVTFLGAYWLVGGLFMIASLFVDRSSMGIKLILAVINIFAGLLILLHPYFATFFALEFLVLFLGFWAIFIGAVHLDQAYTTKDLGNAVLGIISIIFGILLLLTSFAVVIILPFVAGGFCLVSGLSTLYVAFVARKSAGAPAA